MRRAIVPLLLLLMVQGAFAGSEAILVSKGSAVTAQLLYYEPVPVQPGDSVDVWIQIENNGGGPTKPGVLTILDSGSVSPDTESDRVNQVPSIPARQSFLLQLKVRVSKDANEGTHDIVTRFQEEGSSASVETKLQINVQEQASALTIKTVSTEPEELRPGQEGKINILVENVGSALLRNVDLTLDDLEMAPTKNSNSKTIRSLGGGEEHLFTFEVTVYPEAQTTAVRVPVTVTYNDEQGNERSQNESIGLVIGTKPELLVYFDDLQLTTTKNEGDVVLKFVNKGLAEIKLLEAEVEEDPQVQVTSESPIVYVGNIDKDDYESASMRLKVSPGTDTVNVRVAYKDALNRQYEQTLTIPLRLQKGQRSRTPGWPALLIGLLVLTGGYWYWRRRK